MAQLQLYTKVDVFINGAQALEEADVKLTRNSGLMPVNTVAKGLAGFSQGASFLEIEVTGGVPVAGFEYNPGPDMLNANIVQFTLRVGSGGTNPKTLTSNGALMGDDLSHGVNQESKQSFRFHGEFADWQ